MTTHEPSGSFGSRVEGVPADDDHVDVNALAGILSEVFTVDMTTAPRRCAGCGLDAELGAHRVYHGAGWVVRCPGCDTVAMRMGVFDDELTFMWSGVVTVPRAG